MDASLTLLALKAKDLLEKQKKKYALNDKLIRKIQFKTYLRQFYSSAFEHIEIVAVASRKKSLFKRG